MAYSNRLRKRIAMRRKLQFLRALNISSVKRSYVDKSAFLYVHLLKLKLEAVCREYSNLVKKNSNPTKEVKVEKTEEGTFVIKVRCEKQGDRLVSVLQAFEEMGLQVLQARVSCDKCFAMEATAVSQNEALDVRDVTQAITKAIQKQDDEEKRA
ncbi:hypothetical protein UlMin_018665 [Ulmus minor]